MVQVSIRLATPRDLSSILEINKWSTPGGAALAVREVEDMLAASPYCRVATVACRVVEYVRGSLASSPYSGEEFAWFQRQYPTFLSIDQVAVRASFRGADIGTQLSHDVEQWARQRHVPLLACAVHRHPPNPGSFRCHTRWGSHAIQELDTQDGRQVTLMVKRLQNV